MYRDDSDRAEILAAVLKQAREKKGFSQEELARMVNVSTETIRKLEKKSTASPGFFVIADLARALDIKIQKLTVVPRRRP